MTRTEKVWATAAALLPGAVEGALAARRVAEGARMAVLVGVFAAELVVGVVWAVGAAW
jgi:hypothetical protein